MTDDTLPGAAPHLAARALPEDATGHHFMNANCNHPAETAVANPCILEPEDQERILRAEIKRQNNLIAVAIGYLKAGEPHQARITLEAAHV